MTLLQGDALSFRRNGQTILEGVEITLAKGEMLGLIGPNGAGKSTLLKLVAGLLEPDRGELSLDSEPFDAVSPRERARRIAYLPQLSRIAWPMQVERLVALGRIPHLEPWQKLSAKDREIIEAVIEQTDLQAFRHRPFNNLSGGEQARVLLARALVTGADILLADEPVSALDPAHQLDVMELLGAQCDCGRSVIVVLHDLSLAAHYCHRLQLLHQGRTLAAGSNEKVITAKNLETAYAIASNSPNELDLSSFKLNWRRLKG
jgi:iron complex transport system ATP-binding protein